MLIEIVVFVAISSCAVSQSHPKLILTQKGVTEIRAQLNDYLKSNLSPDQFARIAALNIDIDPTNYTLTVTADGQSDPHFMKLAGISKLDYRAISQIKAPFGGLEIALVLDNTGSMNNDNKIDDLKSAAHGFVDEMMVKPSGGKVKIGLVPFADYVNVGL